ncbi:hypothetical protein [Poseidonocella sp. HB161398]|nr:hypothetical protein [Poseidonocella sp. HB161398]
MMDLILLASVLGLSFGFSREAGADLWRLVRTWSRRALARWRP